MLNVVFENRFKKDLRKLKSSNRDEDELLAVIALLANEEPLDERFRDHNLIGNYAGRCAFDAPCLGDSSNRRARVVKVLCRAYPVHSFQLKTV